MRPIVCGTESSTSTGNRSFVSYLIALVFQNHLDSLWIKCCDLSLIYRCTGQFLLWIFTKTKTARNVTKLKGKPLWRINIFLSLAVFWYSYLHWYLGHVSYLLLGVFKPLFVAVTREREKAFMKYNRNRSYTSRELPCSERLFALLLVNTWHLFIHSPAYSSSSSSLPPPLPRSSGTCVLLLTYFLPYEHFLHYITRLEESAMKYWYRHQSNSGREVWNELVRHASYERQAAGRWSQRGTEPILACGAAGGWERAGRQTGQDLRKVWESIVVYSVLKSK